MWLLRHHVLKEAAKSRIELYNLTKPKIDQDLQTVINTMSLNKVSKRTYDDCNAGHANASVQGTSQPHSRSYGYHSNNNAKRPKPNTPGIVNIPESCNGPWNPLRVYDHQPEPTWTSATEPCSSTLGTLPPQGSNYFPASMSNVSEYSWSQETSENLYSMESDKVDCRGRNSSPWTGSTPPTGPHTIRSSASKAETDDIEFNFNIPMDSSSHTVPFPAHIDQEVAHVTRNADWLCGLELSNNWPGCSANANSIHDSCRHSPGQVPPSETLPGTRDTHCKD